MKSLGRRWNTIQSVGPLQAQILIKLASYFILKMCMNRFVDHKGPEGVTLMRELNVLVKAVFKSPHSAALSESKKRIVYGNKLAPQVAV